MTLSPKFKGLIDCVRFTHEFREVIRIARAPNGDRYENDAEHSCQLAIAAWYLIETDKLKLNKERCLMYALAHDLVEIYAGDTYAFDGDARSHKSKKRREQEARKKIAKRFPGFKTLAGIISDYEDKKDEESKFVYALDKLLPPIQIYMEQGKLWHEKGVSFEALIENKAPKIAVSPAVAAYWKELSRELAKRRKELFPRV